MIYWNPNNHSDEENLRWCWLRAAEWGNWPLFVTQPLVPILLLYFDVKIIIISIFILNLLWGFIRYFFVSRILADLGSIFVFLKWPVSIGMCIYFYSIGLNKLSIISLLWPLIVLLLIIIPLPPPVQIGILQKKFMEKFGYNKNEY